MSLCLLDLLSHVIDFVTSLPNRVIDIIIRNTLYSTNITQETIPVYPLQNSVLFIKYYYNIVIGKQDTGCVLNRTRYVIVTH